MQGKTFKQVLTFQMGNLTILNTSLAKKVQEFLRISQIQGRSHRLFKRLLISGSAIQKSIFKMQTTLE